VRYLLAVAGLIAGPVLANGELLFRDQHSTSDNSQIVYSFESKVQNPKTKVEKMAASAVGLAWALRFYEIQDATIVSTELKTDPMQYWLVRLNGSTHGRRELFYAAVLPDGSIVTPTVTRPGRTDESYVDLSSSTIVPKAPPLEIHGEIDFTFGVGKGYGRAGEYPLLDSTRVRPDWLHAGQALEHP
jgi:hypothetical protein